MFIIVPERVADVTTGIRFYRVYLPCRSFDVEIPDIWYERRTGEATERDRRQHLAWGKPLPERGKFSSLCHARLPASWMWPYAMPDDAFPTDQIQVTENTNQPYLCPVYRRQSGSVYRTSLRVVANQTLRRDGRTVSAVTISSIDCDFFGHTLYAQRKEWWIDPDYPNRVRNYQYYNFRRTLTPEELAIGYAWPQRELQSLSDTACVESGDLVRYTQSLSDLNPRNLDRVPEPDYVKTWGLNVANAALQYNDLQVVDWSVGDKVERPSSLDTLDLVASRARAYSDALDDIPLANENALQCLAEAFTGLACFAFDSEATEGAIKQLCKVRGGKDWYRTNRFGQTAAERRRALRRAAYEESLVRWDPNHILRDVDGWRERFGNKWLKGRYVFSTSVMDAESGWKYFRDQALRWVGVRSDDYKCHGVDDADWGKFQITFTVKERALTGVIKAFEHAYRLGLEPNAYVMWDFVPFSFVVDWFFPIGNALNAYTKASHFCPEYWEYLPIYDGRGFCCSITYTVETLVGVVEVYTRWYERDVPSVEPAYVLVKPDSPSQSTVCKRVIDGIALFHL